MPITGKLSLVEKLDIIAAVAFDSIRKLVRKYLLMSLEGNIYVSAGVCLNIYIIYIILCRYI